MQLVVPETVYREVLGAFIKAKIAQDSKALQMALDVLFLYLKEEDECLPCQELLENDLSLPILHQEQD